MADEPVSNLDPALAEDVLALLADVSQRHNATLLMSLHQPRLAQQYADRIIGLRAGRIVYDDRAEHFNQAAIQTIYGRSVGVNESLHNTGHETYAGDYSVPVQEWPIASAYAQVTP